MASPLAKTEEKVQITIQNNEFYPDFEIYDFRLAMRVEQPISNDQVLSVLQNAMIKVNRELQPWLLQQKERGFNTLLEILSDHYNEKTELEILYQTAVYQLAKALLVEQWRDYDLTQSGNDQADLTIPTINHHLQRSKEAVREILKRDRTTCELI